MGSFLARSFELFESFVSFGPFTSFGTFCQNDSNDSNDSNGSNESNVLPAERDARRRAPEVQVAEPDIELVIRFRVGELPVVADVA